MNKNLVVGSIAVGALILSVLGLLTQPEPPQITVGTASSPSIVDGCINVDGVQRCVRTQKMATATTTVCSLRAPRNATSTLVAFAANFNVATASASSVYIAKAVSSPTASTTALTAIQSFAATQAFPLIFGSSGDLVGQYNGSVATTTKTTSLLTFAPGHFLNISVQGADSGGTDRLAGLQTSRGNCYAEFLLHP